MRQLFFSNMANKRSYNVTFDSLLQYSSNSSALAMELLQSCTNPSIWKKERWLVLMRALEWRVCDIIILGASDLMLMWLVMHALMETLVIIFMKTTFHFFFVVITVAAFDPIPHLSLNKWPILCRRHFHIHFLEWKSYIMNESHRNVLGRAQVTMC